MASSNKKQADQKSIPRARGRKLPANPYRTVFDHALDALIVIDAKSEKILAANRSVETILGYNRKTVRGKPFTFLLSEEAEFTSDLNNQNNRFYGPVFMRKFKRGDGKTCYLDLTVTMISWRGKDAFLASFRDVSERVSVEKEKEKLIADLQDAINKINTLKGLVPICAYCKKIRNDQGYWQQIEVFIHEHSGAEFSHGICPSCMKKNFPEFADDIEEK